MVGTHNSKVIKIISTFAIVSLTDCATDTYKEDIFTTYIHP